MADTSKIEEKKDLTEAEKAAQALREQKTPEQLKKEQEEAEKQAREKEAMKTLEKTKTETQNSLSSIKNEISPEQLANRETIEKNLALKIQEAPKTVPAYLDFIAETHSESLWEKWFMLFLSQQIQKLLDIVATKPELSRDRDWMDSLRHSLTHIIIDPTLAKQLAEYGTMDPVLREQLQKQLWVENITEWLDANTRDIVQKVHTGFYRFDPEVNTWVNSVGALVFLWPENIAGIKKYLTAVKPDHPFLSVTDYRSSDKAGKYGIVSDGRPHNMMLAEADYLTQYIKLRGEGKDDNAVFLELGRTHVANLADNKAVQDAVKAFEKKYGDGSFNASVSEQLSAQSDKVSDNVLPAKIPEYNRITDLVQLEKYEYIIDEQRPEMKDIIYDIAAGFVRFDEGTHTFKTATGEKLRFTDKELALIDDVFQDIRPGSLFLVDTQILTYTTTDRDHHQYDEKTLRDRINFYQQ
jgi:hypothetical protein